MKQLEYLKKLIKNGNSDLLTDFLYEDFDATTMLLQELIKVPTADEIVKELELELLETEWEYNKSSKMFSQIISARIGWRNTIEKDDLYMLSSVSCKLAHKITSFFMAKEK